MLDDMEHQHTNRSSSDDDRAGTRAQSKRLKSTSSRFTDGDKESTRSKHGGETSKRESNKHHEERSNGLNGTGHSETKPSSIKLHDQEKPLAPTMITGASTMQNVKHLNQLPGALALVTSPDTREGT